MARRSARSEAEIVRCSLRAAATVDDDLRRGRRAARAAPAAMSCATSSTATSTTPMSAATNAASAPSPKARLSEQLRGTPYDLALDEVARRAREAWERGATEVCMQGGINPHYTGDTYLDTAARGERRSAGHARPCLLAARGGAGRGDARISRCARFLERLRDAGLGSLPGTAAEILDDEVRAIICPDKLSTRAMARRHRRRASSWACGPPRPSCSAMSSRRRTGRGTCCSCAICRSAPAASPNSCRCPSSIWRRRCTLRGQSRKGPTWREVRLMHAVARLALHPAHPQHPGVVGEARRGRRRRAA